MIDLPKRERLGSLTELTLGGGTALGDPIFAHGGVRRHAAGSDHLPYPELMMAGPEVRRDPALRACVA